MSKLQPKVVLVEPSHPGNIGAVARAMKTMSLSNLAIVRPKQFPHPEATARASRATDILENAYLHETLQQAIADCHWVVGVTARPRKISTAVYSPKQLMQKLAEDYAGLRVAWVFGREQHGLSNDEIDLCHAICTIPANSGYSSLNLASAVQIICYEWVSSGMDSAINANSDGNSHEAMASADELEGLYEHLWNTLAQTGFMEQDNPKPLMRKIRKIFDRTRLTRAEINILRGILKSVNKQ